MEDAVPDARRRPCGDRRAVQAPAVERLPVEPHEPRREAAAFRHHGRVHDPVFLGLERLDLGLARADQPERHRLHPPRRASAADLAPQQRREVEPHKVVQRASRLPGAHKVHVDPARARHRLAHRLGRDLVEGDAPDRLALQRAPLAQPFQHLPGDRLALAVRVGGEHQDVGLRERFRDRAHHPRRPAPGRIRHGETARGVDRAVLRCKVPHVAPGGDDPVAGRPDTP